MACVFFIQTLSQKPAGGQFAAPFRVPDASLEAFVERLANDGVTVAEQLVVSAPDRNGDSWILDTRKVAIGLATIGIITPYRHPVRETARSEAA